MKKLTALGLFLMFGVCQIAFATDFKSEVLKTLEGKYELKCNRAGESLFVCPASVGRQLWVLINENGRKSRVALIFHNEDTAQILRKLKLAADREVIAQARGESSSNASFEEFMKKSYEATHKLGVIEETPIGKTLLDSLTDYAKETYGESVKIKTGKTFRSTGTGVPHIGTIVIKL